MSKLHVSLYVPELEAGIRYYAALFNSEPTHLNAGYAQWKLEDPSINFVIEESRENQGLNHLGLEAASTAELDEIYRRFDATGGEVSARGTAQCCYAVSDKGWAHDPAGIAWEGFHTHRRSADYGVPGDITAAPANAARDGEKQTKDSCC
jgi:catechol 2,3-dioxygenase-like lactoylglutathione lyase family enzyme